MLEHARIVEMLSPRTMEESINPFVLINADMTGGTSIYLKARRKINTPIFVQIAERSSMQEKIRNTAVTHVTSHQDLEVHRDRYIFKKQSVRTCTTACDDKRSNEK